MNIITYQLSTYVSKRVSGSMYNSWWSNDVSDIFVLMGYHNGAASNKCRSSNLKSNRSICSNEIHLKVSLLMIGQDVCSLIQSPAFFLQRSVIQKCTEFKVSFVCFTKIFMDMTMRQETCLAYVNNVSSNTCNSHMIVRNKSPIKVFTTNHYCHRKPINDRFALRCSKQGPYCDIVRIND